MNPNRSDNTGFAIRSPNEGGNNMTRLDLQKGTIRPHIRKNKRWYQRGYATLPHEVWGDTRAGTSGTQPGAATCTLTSIAPTTAADSTTRATITLTGTGFTAAAKAYVRDGDGYVRDEVPTTYSSATTMTCTVDVSAEGLYFITVRKPGEVDTAERALTVT